MSRPRLLQVLAISGAALTVTLLGGAPALAAATTPTPSPSCKVPVLTVSQASVKAGSKITVSGKNFSGCTVQGSSTKPTPVLPVKVGVVNAAKQTKVLATTKTSSSGSFSVQVTIPSISTAGKGKIAVVAASMDPATKLDYAGVRAITYRAATPTSPPATTTTSSPTPTAVPAGSGGQGSSTTSARYGLELGLGAAGVALLAVGALGVNRRRTRQQH